MRLFVGNLAYSTTEDRLRQEFERFGNVTSVAVVIDRMRLNSASSSCG